MLHLYIIDYFNQNSTGLTTYVSHLTKYFSTNRNIRLNLILVKASGYKQIVRINEDKVVKYLVPHDPGRIMSRELDKQMCDFLKSEIGTEENPVFHFNWINHAPLAQLLKKNITCSTILTKHCMPWRDLVTGFFPLFSILDRQLSLQTTGRYLDPALISEWVSYQSVDHIICVTKFARNSLQYLMKIPTEKISVISNGFHLKSLKVKDKLALRRKYNFQEDEQLILFAGNLIERKGIFDLIKAFNKISKKKSKVRLIISGDGDYKKIFKHINGNWLKITLTGFLDKRTLYEFYQMADVGVIPSYVEQCSYTAIEMMHHGLPIVAADVDGLSELINDDRGFKLPLSYGDKSARLPSDQLADQILIPLENQKLATEKAENARFYAQHFLTSSEMINKTLSLYSQLINRLPVTYNKVSPNKVTPLVSIILPCNNASFFISECIDSVLSQTYSNFELIVIDDGSDDDSFDLVEKYQDTRIVILRNETKMGIVASLNRGIREANGDYIARIDSDDMMHASRLEKQVEFLEHFTHKSIDVVGSNHYVIDSAGCIVGLKEYPVHSEEIRTSILFHNPFSHPSVLLRRRVVNKINYSTEYEHAEDYHLWFKILRNHSAANIPECLTYYRVHSKNVSNTHATAQKESVANLLSDELERLNIQHSVEELTTHIAISQGLGPKFFNSVEKLNLLERWIDKVLTGQKKEYQSSEAHNVEMKSHIRRFYCGLT